MVLKTIEKSWLSLLNNDNTDIAKLDHFSKVLEDRYALSLSKEFKALAYEDDIGRYYPAEHEAIITYLILSMNYIKKKKPKLARVELKRASRYLEANYGTEREHFDSPSLRIWHAALWASLDEWESAKVDLRAAYKMDKTQTWIPQMLKRKEAPYFIDIYMSGKGPKLKWRPKFDSLGNSISNIDFILDLKPTRISSCQSNNHILQRSFSTRLVY